MILFAVLAWASLAALYLLLVGQAGASELMAGAAFATACTAYACIAHLRARRALSLPRRWPLVAAGAVAQLFPDAARVGWALLLGRRGALALQPFRTGGESGPDAAHRAIAIPRGVGRAERVRGHAARRRPGDAAASPGAAQDERGSGVAGMNPFMVATLAMLPAFAIPVFSSLRGAAAGRLVAVQLASALAALLLVLMTFAFDQPALIDLALTLVLLTLPGTLVLAFFLGRWL